MSEIDNEIARERKASQERQARSAFHMALDPVTSGLRPVETDNPHADLIVDFFGRVAPDRLDAMFLVRGPDTQMYLVPEVPARLRPKPATSRTPRPPLSKREQGRMTRWASDRKAWLDENAVPCGAVVMYVVADRNDDSNSPVWLATVGGQGFYCNRAIDLIPRPALVSGLVQTLARVGTSASPGTPDD